MGAIERRAALIAALLMLAGCASTSITQLSRNQAVVSTSAAPICHTDGATSVASQSAAIATIKQGFSRYIILGYGAEDNTRTITTGPTYATTNGSFNRFGNTVYGNATTTYGGEMTFVTGRNEAQVRVVMLNPGDEGYDQALDAKQALGPDWEKKVKNGVPTCL
jgi:hypothetical protein